MEMPKIEECDVLNCAYNIDEKCHANAITIRASCPRCDTFIEEENHVSPAPEGHVGACHEDDCKFNQQLSCQAPGIHVGFHMEHAECLTFDPMR